MWNFTISGIFSDDFPDLFSVVRVPSKTGACHRQITICPLLQLWQTVNSNQALPRKFCSVFLHTFKTVSTEILLPGILYKGLTCRWHVSYFSGAVVVMPVSVSVTSSVPSHRQSPAPPLNFHRVFQWTNCPAVSSPCPAAPTLTGLPRQNRPQGWCMRDFTAQVPLSLLTEPAWPDLFFQDFALEIA